MLIKSLSVSFALHNDTEVGRKDCALLLVLHEMLLNQMAALDINDIKDDFHLPIYI